MRLSQPGQNTDRRTPRNDGTTASKPAIARQNRHMNGGYTKLFSSIVASTIWREPDHVRLVWITMLAISDGCGQVHASVPGLADLARVSIEHCEDALSRLSAPDEYSRTKDHEGRRIEEIDGGWLILNYVKHRLSGTQDHRREYMREYMQQRRKQSVNNRKQCVNTCKPLLEQAEAEAEAEVHVSKSVDVRGCGGKARREPRQRQQKQTDEEWINELKSNPAYEGVDVPREHARMVAWCSVNGKQPSRRRFVNWLNRAERPMRVTRATTEDEHLKGF